MTRAVFDCMIFLQAATNDRGPAFACLSLVEANEVDLFITPGILAEVRDVLTRPKLRATFPQLTRDVVDTFLQKIVALATLVAESPDAGVVIRDPDDLPYLNLAVAANAEYLVSRDNDLLSLMRDRSFVEKYPRLQVVDPAMFLSAVRATGRP
ncbi:MAG: putative toxin-antitoxin system toxin component, PIN family [Planctomycetaceae bacterium]|nr:putative toxin-antitoxin system toxin component, PIN family [Planctomycetaceae bacterium]